MKKILLLVLGGLFLCLMLANGVSAAGSCSSAARLCAMAGPGWDLICYQDELVSDHGLCYCMESGVEWGEWIWVTWCWLV